MTHDPVQSDLDLASRLLRDNRPESEIVAVLTTRGLDPARAAQLVADLRTGKPIVLEMPFGSEFGDLYESETEPYPPAEERRPSASGARRRREKSAKPRRFQLWLLVGVVLVLGGLALAYYYFFARPGA